MKRLYSGTKGEHLMKQYMQPTLEVCWADEIDCLIASSESIDCNALDQIDISKYFNIK